MAEIGGYYTLFRGKDSNYYFNLKAGNHKIILRGTERYKSQSDALTGIRSVQANCSIDERFEIVTAKNGEPFFRLKAGNYEIIGFGETYDSKAGLENGLDSVKLNGKSKIIKGTDESRYELTIGNRTFDVKEGAITREEILELAGLRGRWCLFLLDDKGARTEVVAGQVINVKDCLKFAVVRLD